MAQTATRYILTVSCMDRIGIVTAVSTMLSDFECLVTESHNYGDPDTGRFFMRVAFSVTPSGFNREVFLRAVQGLRDTHDMDIRLYDPAEPRRVVIMVSKFDHCLNDLLFRYRTGTLHMTIPCIVSNHEKLRDLADWHKIPFHHIPVTADTKAEAETALDSLLEKYQAQTIVLARYMQILSPALVTKYAGRIINIHHSFLPGFKGARPYHRAHERGVKLIGATAHFVTEDLDEGPIIEQHVERVEHFHRPEDMIALGRDVESLTLSRALKYELERRVFLNGPKTVVFRR